MAAVSKTKKEASSAPLPPSPTLQTTSAPEPFPGALQPFPQYLPPHFAEFDNWSLPKSDSLLDGKISGVGQAGVAGDDYPLSDLPSQFNTTQARTRSASLDARGRAYRPRPSGRAQSSALPVPRYAMTDIVYPTLSSDRNIYTAANNATIATTNTNDDDDDRDNQVPGIRIHKGRLRITLPKPFWNKPVFRGRFCASQPGNNAPTPNRYVRSARFGVGVLGFLLVLISAVVVVAAIGFFILVLLNNYFHFMPEKFARAFRQSVEKRWAAGQ